MKHLRAVARPGAIGAVGDDRPRRSRIETVVQARYELIRGRIGRVSEQCDGLRPVHLHQVGSLFDTAAQRGAMSIQRDAAARGAHAAHGSPSMILRESARQQVQAALGAHRLDSRIQRMFNLDVVERHGMLIDLRQLARRAIEHRHTGARRDVPVDDPQMQSLGACVRSDVRSRTSGQHCGRGDPVRAEHHGDACGVQRFAAGDPHDLERALDPVKSLDDIGDIERGAESDRRDHASIAPISSASDACAAVPPG